MEKVKQIFNFLPLYVWGILGVILLVCVFWFSDDIGSWYEARQQAKFDKADAAKELKISELEKQRDELLIKSAQAEMKEQSKTLEVDLLRQEAAKQGVNIQNAQNKIDAANKKFTEDSQVIEKFSNGQMTALQFCELQCQNSAKEGFPCRVNYCDKFK